MKNCNVKRMISMLLCVVMLVTVMPLGAFASTEPSVSEKSPVTNAENDGTAAPDLSDASFALKEAREHVDAVLEEHLGATVMAQSDVKGAIASMSDIQLVSAWEDAQTVIAEINALTDAEFYLLARHASMDTFGFFYEELESLLGGELKQYAAKTNTLFDGKVSITDTTGNGSLSGTTLTATAKGSLLSKKSNTITIVNESADMANVSFDYTVNASSAFTIDGASAAVSGNVSKVLAPGASIVLVITSNSGLSNTTVKITMSNISYAAAAAESNVTINFDSAYGSVTAAGASVASGSSQTVSLSDGIALSATVASGARFLGWINEATGEILSKTASFTYTPSADVTVKAVFAGSNSVPYFGIGSKTEKSVSSGLLGLSKIYYYTIGTTHIYSDLNAAATAAKTAGKDVVLLNDGTLPAGTYTIPAGVHLLIPFSDDNRMYTTQVENVSYTEYKTPTAYRTLTLADGADLVINGAVSISAKQQCAQGARQNGGSPSGNVGFIRMQGTSNITVNNGGTLYAYGFITGSGSVTANSGATVYECFQMMDFRGGSQTTDIKNGVFPVSQYYVQNIEVPLTLYAGASEYSYTSVNMQSSDFGSAVEFISSDGAMFNLTSGYVVKRYDGATDRLVVESYGDMSVSPITMKVGTNSMDTDKYELGINSNITVSALSGTITIAQDIAMLPGSKIIVGNGVNCIIAKGVSIYVYDMDEWGGYCAPANKKLIPINYAPGKTYTRTEADLVDAEIIVNGIIDATQGYLYCTAGGANVYSQGGGVIKSKPGTQKVTYQLVQAGDVNNSTYPEIPLVPAVVKNADGTTISLTSPNGTYTYIDGKWVVTACEHVYASSTKDATCTEIGTVTYTCPCGDVYIEEIPAKGHTAGSAPTCTEAQSCSVCGAELIPALGHDHTSSVTKEATCTEAGVRTYVCSCGDTYTEEIPALGHTHISSVTLEPTCTEAGVRTYACSCGDSYTEEIPALGHDHVLSESKAPSCTEPGYTEYTCSCGDSYREELAALGHSITVSEAAAGEHTLGVRRELCTSCGYETVTYTDALNGLIIYVDPAAESGGNGTAEAPFNNYAACFEYAGGAFDATVVLLGEVVLGESFTESAHEGEFVIRAENGGLLLVDGVIYTAGGKLTFESMSLSSNGRAELVVTDLTVGEGVTGNGGVAITGGENATEITVRSGSFADIKSGTADLTLDGATVSGSVQAGTDTVLRVTNGFNYKDSFTSEGAGFFGGEGSVIYVYSAYVTFEQGKGSLEGFSEVHDMRTDVDGDGEIANDDITVIIRHLSGFDTGYADVSFDVNCDGRINNRDAICVITKVAFAASAANAISDYYPEDIETYVPAAAELPVYASVAGEGEKSIQSYEEFILGLMYLEEIAALYTTEMAPAKDPLALVIKYIRTGVDRYNSGSWGIMAGYDDAEFAQFVAATEEAINSEVTDGIYLNCTGLKNISKFHLPNGDFADIGHMFGSMDITYHNKGSVNHADVSGWAGDLVDLLEYADKMGVSGSLDEMIADVAKNYFAKTPTGTNPGFSLEDVYGDLDAYYVMETLYSLEEYSFGNLAIIIMSYFGGELDGEILEPIASAEFRAEFFLKNRLGTTGTRAQIRSEVYNEYTSNKLISTLEGTRDFTSDELATLRRAVCYVFGDYLCKLAGDYVENTENDYYEVFNTVTSNLAPGVVQDVKYATAADGQQMVYYLATADITRSDLTVYANYNNNDPSEWEMSRVLDQANAAQQKYGDPESEHYIPNYSVIASINGAGYDMSTGEPGGLLVMGGVEYHPINSSGFFGITKDGKPVIGTTAEYNDIYKGQLRDGIAGFGATLIKDGEIIVKKVENHYDNRASRTAIGITATGKVVFMVLDGRQEPFSGGGSMEEIAQIMFDAGCVEAVNLDGGGSSTYVSKPEGSDELAVINKPSDGAPRSVSTSLIIVSTAPSSTAFDHAKLTSEYDHLTLGTEMKITATGVSATGNEAQLPEECTWEVSDARYGSITSEGVFKALRGFGSVEVYLMHGEDIVGRKTINLVTPEKVYFTKELVNAVYGSAIALPIAGMYGGKKVGFNENDVIIKVANEAAGRIEGFKFIASENTAYKSVKVTIALAGDEFNTTSIIVNLFKQGENTFDFDRATGGDRQLAFLREVTNSTTEDSVTYLAIDTDAKMTTSYVFAMDMTKIPIPEQLSDLIYMLPGADMENASAWNFLLQLAERVSTLTEVTPVLRFDPRFDVDYSELKILNEYFVLEATEFDAEHNALTLRLRWIDRTQAIDPATANPLCLVSGIKLTPKDGADWGAKNRMEVSHSGEIGYNVFLRANALYSFAQKPENQATYGLLPFVNPNDPSETGASFGSVYKSFTDTYTLVNALKNGWYNEDGGFAYYVQGTKYYGVRSVDDVYYDFGNNGINVGQTPYTGLFYDSELDVFRYAKNGGLVSGWHLINEKWHYFDPTTKNAANGTLKLDGVYYDFTANGQVVTGKWIHTLQGVRYYYGPTFHKSNWQYIDGDWYYFRNGYRVTGISEVQSRHTSFLREWHDFGADGKDRGFIPDGMIEYQGELFYVVDGLQQIGLIKVGEHYYFFNYEGVIRNKKYYAWETHCDLPMSNYEFGEDGRMLDGIVERDGISYYYVNGKTADCGLTVIDGEYYYVYWGGVIKTGRQHVVRTNCDLPANCYYTFGADGRMLDGIVEEDGRLYYYDNGNYGDCGLIKLDGGYYYVYWGGVIKTGKQYVTRTNCDLPVGNYEFGEDGRMRYGIVERDGNLYYYEDGKLGDCGLIKLDGGYYYVYWGGVIKTGKQYVVRTKCDLPAMKNYEFGDDGRMLDGIVEIGTTKYYYVNGALADCGMIELDGDYYYVYWGGVIKTGKQYVVRTKCDLPAMKNYEFGDDGRMLDGIVERDGNLYYYEDGKLGDCGLIKLDGGYYYVYWGGVIKTGKQYVSRTNCDLPIGNYMFAEDGRLMTGFAESEGKTYYYENGKSLTRGLYKIDGSYYFIDYGGVLATGSVNVPLSYCDLPTGTYEFGEDGRMLDGIVERGGAMYYYENGKLGECGLTLIDGDYYYVYWGGVIKTGKQYVVRTNCELPASKHYVFGEDGRMLRGFVEIDGVLYYFTDGRPEFRGLIMVDGYFYYVYYDGKLITNRRFYVGVTNDLMIETNYTFDEYGRIVG